MSYAHNTDVSWVTLLELDLLFMDFEKSNAVPKISLKSAEFILSCLRSHTLSVLSS